MNKQILSWAVVLRINIYIYILYIYLGRAHLPQVGARVQGNSINPLMKGLQHKMHVRYTTLYYRLHNSKRVARSAP